MDFKVIQDQYQILVNGWPITDLVAAFSIIGLIIGWWLSSSSRKESARANTLQSLPIVTLNLIHRDSDIQAKNIGSSPATNIKIDPYYHPMYDDFIENKGKILSLKFKTVPLLLKEEEKTIDATAKIAGIINKSWLKQIMMYSEHPLVFNIRYKDLSGRAYFIRIKMIDGIVTISTPPTKFNLYRKISYIYYRISEQININTKGRWFFIKNKLEYRKKKK